MPQSKIHRFALFLTFSCLALAAAAPVASAKGTGLVVSPTPAQSVGGDHVAIVVKAGPAGPGLKARLNGVTIGRRFLVGDGDQRRVLQATPADGLRRGRNTLRVWVVGPAGYRQRTVHFKVAHKRPLASAGIDRRIVVGSRFELRGLLRLDKSDPGRKRLRWDVVKAPARSALSRPQGTSARVTAEASAFEGRRTLTPTFRPDVLGRYKVRLTAVSGNGTSSDTATIYAVPPNPLIVLKTAVPATATEPRPGIQVGDEILRAPYMHTEGSGGNYNGSAEGFEYMAVWQLVAYDRVTMALKWNRTYGICANLSVGIYVCTPGPNGIPKKVSLPAELAALGPETLVVAASHPSGTAPGLGWAGPGWAGFVANNLTGIGLPTESQIPNLAAAQGGEMAAVGVPGLAPGDAKFIVGGGQTGLNGYLTQDSNSPKRYFFVPGAREPFDTLFAGECGTQSCTVAQKVGANEVNGSVADGMGGFLVSAFDRHTLAPIEHRVFTTATGLNEGSTGTGAVETSQMATFLASLAASEAIVVVTSIHATGQNPSVLFTRGTTAAAWQELTTKIVALGGSREAFNTAATVAADNYSLVGYAGLEEGAGQETVGSGARLRGAFVPDARSQFEPQGVTSGEAVPNEQLMQIAMRAPQSSSWPLEGNAAGQEAILAVAKSSPLLGSDPRAAYWTQLTNATLAGEALKSVEGSTFPKEAKFSEGVWKEAKGEIEKELLEVEVTRTYMTELAQPAHLAGKIGWEEASLIAAELEARLKQLKEEGQAKAEYLSILEEVLEAVSLGADVKGWAETMKFMTGAAIAAEAGQTLWSADPGGGPVETGITGKALNLGKTLRLQAEGNEAFFVRLGDIIVSDPTKLAEVGKYGGCNPNGGCGAYEGLAFNEEMEKTAAATMKRGFDRDIYGRLVPLAYPIWNTGTSRNHEATVPASEFGCSDDSYPFEGAPQLAYHRGLWEIDPSTGIETWRVDLSVARSERTYGWASETMLKRMFEPIPASSSNAEEGGLGMDPAAFMRQGLKIKEYVSGWVCDRSAELEREEEEKGQGQ